MVRALESAAVNIWDTARGNRHGRQYGSEAVYQSRRHPEAGADTTAPKSAEGSHYSAIFLGT